MDVQGSEATFVVVGVIGAAINLEISFVGSATNLETESADANIIGSRRMGAIGGVSLV